MDTSYTVEVLFTAGSSFDKVNETAMDFMLDKMESVVLEDKEPFAANRSHSDTFDFLTELLFRKAPNSMAIDKT
ncbi:hypothetical protein BGZ98_006904 [Dissophora globulifera]|nr:hypothetical protein BGZ98_006904 [Dissophora globulifera]